MKLSELFKTPFKVKGGGVLNLKGFSKRVVDREIEGGDNARFPVGEKILNLFDKDLIAHSSKFVIDPSNNDEIIDISQIADIPQKQTDISFLYKKSDIDAAEGSKKIIYQFNVNESILCYNVEQIGSLRKKIYIIDDISYYALYTSMS